MLRQINAYFAGVCPPSHNPDQVASAGSWGGVAVGPCAECWRTAANAQFYGVTSTHLRHGLLSCLPARTHWTEEMLCKYTDELMECVDQGFPFKDNKFQDHVMLRTSSSTRRQSDIAEHVYFQPWERVLETCMPIRRNWADNLETVTRLSKDTIYLDSLNKWPGFSGTWPG